MSDEIKTLHERLREAATSHTTHRNGFNVVLKRDYHGIVPESLAAIEAAILKPWRERVAEYDARLESADTRLAKAEKLVESLSWENGELKKAAVSMSNTCDEWADSYNALKARADALEHKINMAHTAIMAMDLSDDQYQAIVSWFDDAADRAGETQDDTDRPAVGSDDVDDRRDGGNHRDGYRADDVDSASLAPNRRSGAEAVAAPSPTDAAAEGNVWRGSVDASIIDLTERLRSAERKIADLERWREETQKITDTLQVWGVDLQKRITAIEQRLDALRGPEVTNGGPPDGPIPMEAMKEAYEESFAKYGSVRAGLSSAMAAWRKEAALRAGQDKA